MLDRRIEIYLEGRAIDRKTGHRRGRTKTFAKIQMNHAYHAKIEYIRKQRGGCGKSVIIREFLMNIFNTKNVYELKERIYYASEIQNKKISDICKLAIRKAIDNYKLSA